MGTTDSTPSAANSSLLKGGAVILMVITVLALRFPAPSSQPVKTVPASLGKNATDTELLAHGRELARLHCAICHEAPAPGIAPRTTWAFDILPAKRVWLGLDPFDADAHIGGTNLVDQSVFPTTPAISAADWRAIGNYYLAESDSVTSLRSEQPSPPPATDLFEVRSIQAEQMPMYSFVKIDPPLRVMYVGNIAQSALQVISPAGDTLVSREFPSEPSAIAVTPRTLYITLFGNMPLSDEANGSLIAMSKPGSGGPGIGVLDTRLRRPTSVASVDLTGNGELDMIVGEQGGYLGALSWMEKQASGYELHALLKQPGIRSLAVADFNRDSRPDIVALLGFGQEGLFVFLNHEGHGFTNTAKHSKHPRWQFADLAVADFNNDGLPDIATANGASDQFNRDREPIPHHHGISLWLNDGKGSFEERRIHELAGAAKVVAADFNGDGNMDLAAIGYTTEPRQLGAEAFVHLENDGKLGFKPHSLPQAADARWSDLDAGDLDGDGDADLVLVARHPGADSIPSVYAKDWHNKRTGMLILFNRTIGAE